jgi:hypothetical protein
MDWPHGGMSLDPYPHKKHEKREKPMAASSQTSVQNNNSDPLSGMLGGMGTTISWTATATMQIASVAGIPYSGAYTVYDGALAGMTYQFGTTLWNNAALYALGAPYYDFGIGVSAGQLNTTSTDTIAYSFSSAVPVGASFMLVDPGASYPEYSGTETYQISASDNGAAVPISGFSFTVLTPAGAPTSSAISINAAAGTITVSSYAGATWPDSLIQITPNAPITSLGVTATTIPYDFWALTLPVMPSALLFQSVNSATAGAYAAWRVNGTTVTGSGGLGNPGSGMTYEGKGDFLGDGGTDLLWRAQNGALSYWAVSGVKTYGVHQLGTLGAGWMVAGIADFNNDGDSDILIEDGAGDLAVWFVTASGVASQGSIGNPGPGYRLMGTADINGDGDSDLLFETSSGTYVDWMMHGTTVWTTNNLGAAPADDVFAGFGDFNGDGRADILFENPLTGQYTAWIMAGGATIGSVETLCTVGAGETLVSIGDYNLTTPGYSDLVFRNDLTGALSDYVISNATLASSGVIGNAGATYTVAKAPYDAQTPTPTLVFVGPSGALTTWITPQGAIASSANYASPGAAWTLLALGNFDGSGNAGMLFESTSDVYVIWLTNGTQYTASGALGALAATWKFEGIGDFNGDGMSDLLFENSAGVYADWIINGTSRVASRSLGNPGAGYTLAGIADLTGDGTSDLIFRNSSGNYYAWFAANAVHVGTMTKIGAPGAGWSLAGTGDFNGDGKTDLLFENSAGNFMTWDMNGSTEVGGGAFSGPGSGWSYVGIADLNDNLCASILFQNASTGQIEAYNMNDATIASVTVIGTTTTGWTPKAVI